MKRIGATDADLETFVNTSHINSLKSDACAVKCYLNAISFALQEHVLKALTCSKLIIDLCN